MADQFYVYGDGRWRAVDVRTGRVEGWGRAAFAVARGGRLHATRGGPVLAALRALAAGQPSSAALGPPLAARYPQRRASREAGLTRCDHCHCCHHNHSTESSCASKTVTDNKVTVAVQCDHPTNPPPSQARKRKRDSTSFENPHKIPKKKRDSTSSEDLFKEVTTIATVHSPRKSEPKRRNSKSPKKSLKRKRVSTSSDGVKAQKSPSLRVRRPEPVQRNRSSSKESSVILTSRTERRQNKISKYLRSKSKIVHESPIRKTRQNISLVISSDSDFENEPAKLQASKRPKSSSTDHSQLNDLKKGHDITVSSTEKLVNHKINPKRASNRSRHPIKHKIDLDRNTEKASTDEPIKHVVCPEKALFSRLAEPRTQESENQTRSQGDTSKELIIDERDVEILRLFLQKHYPDQELLRFDTDDEYKKIHFYHINPLVNVERCPRIAAMIRAGSQGGITLADFASKLGLRSVSETSSKSKRYKTRRRLETSYIDSHTETDSTDAENKENRQTDITHPRRNKNVEAKRVLRESLNKPKGKDQMKSQSNNKIERDDLKQVGSKIRERDKLRSDSETIEEDKDRVQKINNKRDKNSKTIDNDNIQTGNLTRTKTKEMDKKRDIDNTIDTVELSSDIETEVKINGLKKPEIQKPLLKKPKAKAAISTKRPGLKEYSNLEDHAIVSWVSNGGRANLVNGNRLWRQLQDQFQRLTGHGRTWHSLRNRYLRYILPRLSALALPPQLQARLRAAAATGELKARKKEPRRNSIFTLPARGASSRLHRAPPPGGTGDTDHDADASPPDYSDVTRQFYARQRARRRPSSANSSANNKTSPVPSPVASSDSSGPSDRPSRSSDESDETESGVTPERRLSTRKSIRINTPSEARRRSIRRKSTSPRRDEDGSPGRGSTRVSSSANRRKKKNSPSELKTRKYKRITNRRRSSGSRESSSGSEGRESRGGDSPSESTRPSLRTSPRVSNRRPSDGSETASSKLRESRHKVNGRDSSNESITQRRKSSRRKSPEASNDSSTQRRKSNRRKSFEASNDSSTQRRKSSRRKSPDASNDSSTQRRKSSRGKSPDASNHSSTQRRKSSRRKSPEASRRVFLRGSRGAEASLRPKGTRRLFNPKAVLL